MDYNSDMPFGKYAGEKMANVPARYLTWLFENGIVSVKKWNRVYWYIEKNLDSIQLELNNSKKQKS